MQIYNYHTTLHPRSCKTSDQYDDDDDVVVVWDGVITKPEDGSTLHNIVLGFRDTFKTNTIFDPYIFGLSFTLWEISLITQGLDVPMLILATGNRVLCKESAKNNSLVLAGGVTWDGSECPNKLDQLAFSSSLSANWSGCLGENIAY